MALKKSEQIPKDDYHIRFNDPNYTSRCHEIMGNRARNQECMICGVLIGEDDVNAYYCNKCLEREYPDEYKVLKDKMANWDGDWHKLKNKQLIKAMEARQSEIYNFTQ